MAKFYSNSQKSLSRVFKFLKTLDLQVIRRRKNYNYLEMGCVSSDNNRNTPVGTTNQGQPHIEQASFNSKPSEVQKEKKIMLIEKSLLQHPKIQNENENKSVQQKASKSVEKLQQIKELKTEGLKQILQKSYIEALSKKEYFFYPVFNFVERAIKRRYNQGVSLYESEQVIIQDFKTAQQMYPIGKVEDLQCSIKQKNTQKPDLAGDLKKKGIQTKEKLVDRIHEVCIRGKENHSKFKDELQPLLEIQGGFHFKSGYKMERTKAYLRCMTKILQPYIDIKQGSKQVYTDFNHWYWAPVYKFFNKLMDMHTSEIKIELYDLLRCKCYYKNTKEIEKAYSRLQKKYNVFRVKNRINQGTRDILLNLKFEDSIAEVQLALDCDTTKYDFAHKLYEMTREAIGPAFCCFALGVDDTFNLQAEINAKPKINTRLGLVKSTFLRQKVQPGFERLTVEDARQIKKDLLDNFINEWAILSLNTGTMRGPGYGQLFQSEQYGPEGGQMVVIKKNK